MPIAVSPRLRPLTRSEWWCAGAGTLVGVVLLGVGWLLTALAMPDFSDGEDLGLLFTPELWTALVLIGVFVLTRAVAIGWLLGVAVGVLLTALGPATAKRRAAVVLAPFIGAGCGTAWVLLV